MLENVKVSEKDGKTVIQATLVLNTEPVLSSTGKAYIVGHGDERLPFQVNGETVRLSMLAQYKNRAFKKSENRDVVKQFLAALGK